MLALVDERLVVQFLNDPITPGDTCTLVQHALPRRTRRT